jgi:uncharacterized protein (TIGR02186 family)
MRKDTEVDRTLVGALAFCLGLAGVVGAATVGAVAQEQSIRITPPVVQMATFSGGGGVRIEGAVDADAQVVVAIRGKETEDLLNRKGRVGPIWINSGKVAVSRVPSLFLVFSSASLETILTPEAIEQAALGQAGLTRRMVVSPSTADGPEVRADYVALKTGEGSFRLVEGAVRLDKATGGRTRYSLELQWPTTAPPGTYTATLYECRGGAVTRTVSTGLEVAEVGIAALMRDLAENHGAWYGVIAIVVTMLLGFGIDALVARVRRARRGPPRTVSSAHEDVRVH